MKKRVLSLLLALCLLTGTAALAVGGVSAEGGSGYTVTVKTDGNGQVSADGNTWVDSVDITVADGQKLGNSFSYRANEGYRFDKASLPARINKMVGGYYNFCVIDETGDLWMVGRNDRGQLTRTTDTSELRKVTVGTANNKVKDVSISQFSLLVLDTSGRVWSAGSNTNGQLGDTRNNNQYNSTNPTFAQVTNGIGDTKIVAVAAGVDHSVLIDENGKVWTAGSNRVGQLGRPENAGVFNSNTYMAPANPTFTQVTGDIANVKAVAACAGYGHTIVLDENGEIWSVGQSAYGMTGRPITGAYDAVFTKVGGELAGKKIVSISAGMYHTVLLTEDGEVYGAGTNLYGDLGLPSSTTVVREFTRLAADLGDGKFAYAVAGRNQTYIIDFDGNAYITGFNNSGQIGVPTATTQRVYGFTKVDTGVKYVEAVGGDTYSVLLDANGKLWSAGSGSGAGLILRPDTADNSVFATCTAEIYVDYSIGQMQDRTITSDLTVTLRFKQAQVVKVEYILNGGNWIDGFTPPSFHYADEWFTPPAGKDKLECPGMTFSRWIKAAGVNIERYTAVWTEKNYTINFNTDGGSYVAPKTDAKWYGCPIENVTAPTKAGYDFAGWKYGDKDVTANTLLKNVATDHEASSFEFVAQWTARSDTPYTVERWKQNADNDEYTKFEGESFTGTTGEIPEIWTVLYNGFKTGTYTPTAIAGDGSTVIKVYYDRENYTLTWDANGGTLGGDYTSGSIRYGAKIVAPIVSKEGYFFGGWDSEVPETMPSQDMTLTARWTARSDTHYFVEHYQQNINDDGYVLVDSESLTGTTDTVANVTLKSYTGFESGRCEPTAINGDGSTVAKVYYDRKVYTLSWNADGGTLGGDYTSGSVRYGASITAPTAEKKGSKFLGWDAEIPATMPDGDLTITALWQILARMPDRELVIYYKSVGKLNTITDDPSVVAYSSSDESVVTVDQDGTYTAVGRGTAVITMSVPGSDIEEHCTVTVKYAWWQVLIRIFLLGFIWY